MSRKNIILFGLIFLIAISCEKNSEEKASDKLVKALDQELNPLTKNPLTWSDNDLKFLDPIANKSIIGLGEATHGTAEFFKAKHRIFQYLVENHNYKIFAFEADFGESLLIDEAVQRSATSEIENLMKTKMQFWTWKTEEVKDLLMWMCTYNLNKSEAEKVHYMGIDCQFNTFNPDMVKDYLTLTKAPFFTFAKSILDEAKSSSQTSFASYSKETFNNYLNRVLALQDTLSVHENELIEASSKKQYQLHKRIIEIIRQVCIVNYHINNINLAFKDRDGFMAENAIWLFEYFDRKKVVIWAHDGHISNNPELDNMGYHLSYSYSISYATVGFLFSRGSFIAVGFEGGVYTKPKEHILAGPFENSINFVMSQSKESVFSVKMTDLQNNSGWNDAFNTGMQYFFIGAVYDNSSGNYYSRFSPTFFDYIIYFDKSTASVQL